MRIFVTGPSGHIGSAVVPQLLEAGHEVIGLARSDRSAAAVEAMGASVRRGELSDLDGLREAAGDVDAVVHLAFDHEAMDGGDFAGAVATDLGVVRAIGDGLTGSGPTAGEKAFIAVGMRPTGDPQQDATIEANPRSRVSRAVAGYAERGVRTVLVGIPPVTHSARDRIGFIPRMIATARSTGVSGYVAEGANRWPAAHTLDVAALYRLAVEKAPAGAQLIAATEEGIRVREIAEAVARHLGIPAVSIPPERAAAHFAALPFITMDITMANAATRELLGWTPSHPGLMADLDEGHYFTGAPSIP